MNHLVEEDITDVRPYHPRNANPVGVNIQEGGIHGQGVDFADKFLPDCLSRVDEIDFISVRERRLFSQIQGRTYANTVALIDRFISDMLEDIGKQHREAKPSVGSMQPTSCKEKTREQLLYTQIDKRIGAGMLDGYRFESNARQLANNVSVVSDWSILAFAYHAELSCQAHYKQSTSADANISPIFQDLFISHWREDSQNAIVDGIEWAREDAIQTNDERDRAVDGLVTVLTALDEILRTQAEADVDYFLSISGREFGPVRRERLIGATLGAYRWQHILIGLNVPRFDNTITSFISAKQYQKISNALSYITDRNTLH